MTDGVRKVLLLIPLVTAISVAIILASAILGAFSLSICDANDLEFSYEEGNINVSGSITVESRSLSPVSDADFDFYAFNEDTGASVLLFECNGVEINPRGKTTIPVQQSIPFWALFNIVNDSLTTDGSVLHLRVVASLKYVYGLLDVDTNVSIAYRLSDSGETVSYHFSPMETDTITIWIYGLHNDLKPDDASMIISDGNRTMYVDILNDPDGWFSVKASSAGGLDSAIEDLINGNPLTTTLSGTWNDDNTDALLTALHYARLIQ